MPENFMLSPASGGLLSPKMLGYWSEAQVRDVLDESGIYCVFRVAKDPETEEMIVQQLLYVGEHRSARYGIEHHPDREEWLAFLKPGEELWYSVGLAGYTNRERLAAAMINAHKPRFNHRSQYLDRFPFNETTVHLYGKTDKLQSLFTVERQD